MPSTSCCSRLAKNVPAKSGPAPPLTVLAMSVPQLPTLDSTAGAWTTTPAPAMQAAGAAATAHRPTTPSERAPDPLVVMGAAVALATMP